MLLKWLLVAILITGLAYMFVIPEEPLLMKIICKVIPMLLIFALRQQNRREKESIPNCDTSWTIHLHT
ncbi:hypothetical protein [Peribacillus muralis]|uniref:hypothetical protein n=1 Tax=Peribacillus muralis TaxID=264697 RepID=UPI00070CE63E|nr:hypothetical protein [Peribacillus muralis]